MKTKKPLIIRLKKHLKSICVTEYNNNLLAHSKRTNKYLIPHQVHRLLTAVLWSRKPRQHSSAAIPNENSLQSGMTQGDSTKSRRWSCSYPGLSL